MEYETGRVSDHASSTDLSSLFSGKGDADNPPSQKIPLRQRSSCCSPSISLSVPLPSQLPLHVHCSTRQHLLLPHFLNWTCVQGKTLVGGWVAFQSWFHMYKDYPHLLLKGKSSKSIKISKHEVFQEITTNKQTNKKKPATAPTVMIWACVRVLCTSEYPGDKYDAISNILVQTSIERWPQTQQKKHHSRMQEKTEENPGVAKA